MATCSDSPVADASAVLVPCADCGLAGCEIVRRAVALAAAESSDIAISSPSELARGGRRFVVAVDASSACQASTALEERGIRPAAVVSAPAVLARRGLVRPGVDVRASIEAFAEVLAEEIRGALAGALEELRERQHYREEMSPVIGRFGAVWSKLEALAPPGGAPDEKERAAVELLAKRARNLFMKFDEVVPPAPWAEPHDLFQDALLCIAYASEGWAAGDVERWQHNLEKARLQVRPLLRRLGAEAPEPAGSR